MKNAYLYENIASSIDDGEIQEKKKKKTRLNRNGDDYSTAERDLGS